MSINVRCGKCSMSYTAAEKLAGQQVVCPRCGNSVTVPAPTAKSSDDPLADALGAANSTQVGQTKKSSRRSKRRGKSGSKLQLSGRTGVLLGLLAVLAVAAVVYYMVWPGQSGKRPRRPPAVADAVPTQPGPPGPEISPPSPQPDGTPTTPGQETPAGPAQPETTPTSPQPVNPPTGNPDPNQAPPPTGQGQPTGPNYGPSPGPGYPQYPNTPGGPTQPGQRPQRPQDLAQWKKEDYFSARAEGDARLVEAVGYLAQRFVGNAPAARMLGQLLEPPKSQEDPAKGSQPGYGPQYRQASPQLVQAVVAALAINGTDVALAMIEQLLAGTLATEDDKTAVGAALNVLAAHPSAKAQDIVFRALTAPEKLRTGSGGNVTADQLRETALAAVSATASEPFRTRLATYLAQPGTSPQLREQMGGFLSQQHPDNVGAQLILYQSAQTPPETKATLEQYFIAYSSAALGDVLGMPAVEGTQPGQQPMANPLQRPLQYGGPVGPGGRPGPQRPPQYDGPAGPTGYGPPPSGPNPPGAGPMWRPPAAPGVNQPQTTPADPEAPYRRARQLWSPQTASTVEGRLGQLKSLEGQAQLLMLAGTFPVDSTRSVACKILHDRWADGPAQLESAGLSSSVITDPGLLLTIKTLPRRAEADPGSTPGTTPDGSYRAPSVSPRGNPRQPGDSSQSENRYRPRPRPKPGESGTATEAVETAQQVVEKRMQAERDWMKTSEGLVRAWCARLNAAGLARAGAARGTETGPGGAEPNDNLPVKLHPQANVVSEYHLNWPGDLGAKLSGIAPGPMEIHYLRINDKSDPVKRLGFYRRQLQLKTPDVHPIQNGYWMDRVVRVPKTEEQGPIDKTGWKRSVDILITKVQDKPEPARSEETGLVIEILSIEMKDPAKG